MKFLDEYRDSRGALRLADEIKRICTRPWTLMEICGGQTHAIIRYGIDQLLANKVNLLHGPGCPVCVTPIELIDIAIEIASRKNVIFCTFGDMLRIPGTHHDLLSERASGAVIRTVYSPLDSLNIARENPDRQIVFFAIGFETTAPANALAVAQAEKMGLANFSILSAQVLVPPAIETILASSNHNIQGFLAAGHVCTVSGYSQYEEISQNYNIPFVVTGFEPLDILQGIYMVVNQLEKGTAQVENQYSRVVRRNGNREARKLIDKIFRVSDREWRGLGMIPNSGLELRDGFMEYDARRRFGVEMPQKSIPSICISGQVLRGRKKPHECEAFGTQCTPEHPLGATMVSAEGACAAYFNYRKVFDHSTLTGR